VSEKVSILEVVSRAESEYKLKQKQEEELERFKARFFNSIDFNEKTSTLYYEPESDYSLPCIRLYTNSINNKPFLSIEGVVKVSIAGNKRELKIFNKTVEENHSSRTEKDLFYKEAEKEYKRKQFKKRKKEFSDLSRLIVKKLAEVYDMYVAIFYHATSSSRSYTLLAQDDRDRIEVAFTKY